MRQRNKYTTRFIKTPAFHVTFIQWDFPSLKNNYESSIPFTVVSTIVA